VEGNKPTLLSSYSIEPFRDYIVYWADRAAEGSLASKPMRGDKMRVFSCVCARLPGWFPRTLLAKTRFLEVYATSFSAHVAGICPHTAGQLFFTRGTQRAQKNRAPRLARRGMSIVIVFFLFFFEKKYRRGGGGVVIPTLNPKPRISECPGGVASSFSAHAATSAALDGGGVFGRLAVSQVAGLRSV
jgi:hypothetical protein